MVDNEQNRERSGDYLYQNQLDDPAVIQMMYEDQIKILSESEVGIHTLIFKDCELSVRLGYTVCHVLV